jgi:hypothetical protein
MSRLTTDGRRVAHAAVIAAMTVVAAIGVGGERWASAGDDDGAVPLAAPGAPSVIVPVEPARILDTRTGVGAPAGKVAAGSTITLQVTGAGGVPAGATGVVLNLTATASEGAGYATAYPAGGTQPEASVINYSAGEDVANMVTAQLSAGGALAIFNDQANVHLLADVAGYLLPGSGSSGPQGPQGPQGLQGPAGPGATRIDVEFAVSTATIVATLGGLNLEGYCSAAVNQLRIFTVSEMNDLRVGGTFTDNDSTTIRNSHGDFSGVGHSDEGPVHFSGLIEELTVGAAYQLDLHLTPGNPCRVWGSVIPLG